MNINNLQYPLMRYSPMKLRETSSNRLLVVFKTQKDNLIPFISDHLDYAEIYSFSIDSSCQVESIWYFPYENTENCFPEITPKGLPPHFKCIFSWMQSIYNNPLINGGLNNKRIKED